MIIWLTKTIAHSNSPYALIMATISCMRWALLSAVGPRLAKIGFTYAQPFLISRVISFVEAPASEQLRSHALGLMAAAFLVYISIAVSRSCTPLDLWEILDAEFR